MGLPRMRGDPPGFGYCLIFISRSTPHARGSTLLPSKGRYYMGVYPACAGIHLVTIEGEERIQGLPRMRGDPPAFCFGSYIPEQSTPHARGSTLEWGGYLSARLVYPACAGIHLFDGFRRIPQDGLPRMRGDPPLFSTLDPEA